MVSGAGFHFSVFRFQVSVFGPEGLTICLVTRGGIWPKELSGFGMTCSTLTPEH